MTKPGLSKHKSFQLQIPVLSAVPLAYINGWWVGGYADGWVDGWGWVNEWGGGWMGKWVDGWMDGG